MQVGKAYATRASRAASKKDALALQEEGLQRLQAVFSRGSYASAQQGCLEGVAAEPAGQIVPGLHAGRM